VTPATLPSCQCAIIFGMTSKAELSSISSSLKELHERETALAEGAASGGDSETAYELFAVERSLGGALRRLRKML
jgi:hypothetical protein